MSDYDRLIEELAKVRKDFAAFNRLVFGDNPNGMPPVHPGQERYFYDTLFHKYNVLTCGNSWGKTELIARMHVYYCIYKEGVELPPRDMSYIEYNTLNCAYTYEVSAKEFDRLQRLRQSSEILRFIIDKVDNVHRKVYFKNGSCFVTGSTEKDGRLIEGDRYALLTLEEAGWERKLRFLTENVLRPRTIVPHMPDGGKMHFIGTPKPFSDPYYYTLFKRGEDPKQPRYYSMRGSVYDNIFLSREAIAELERDYANSPYRAQVINGEFVADTDAPFKHEMVFSMFNKNIKRLDSAVPRRKYLVSWDLARKYDKTVGTVLDYTDYPFLVRVNDYTVYKQRWSDVYSLVADVASRFKPTGMVVDSSGIGDVVLERLQELGVHVDGVFITPSVKEQLILRLQDAMSQTVRVPYPYDEIIGEEVTRGALKSYPDSVLENQLISYRWDDKKLETDSIMSLAIGVYYLSDMGVPGSMSIDYIGKRIGGGRWSSVKNRNRRALR